jgi:tRNA (mo5U34)-methyltransferase
LNQLERQRRIDMGRFAVTVVMPEPVAERVATSGLYRKVVRPAAMGGRNLLRRRQRDRSGEGELISARAPQPSDIDPADLKLIQRVARVEWRQVIELGRGVTTPAALDYRPHLAALGLPESLAGMRCLDATTRDGFFAFELERRGAAEVVALDWEPFVDIPLADPGAQVGGDPEAFFVAHDILESRVKAVAGHPCSPDFEKLGKFDHVVAVDLLGRVRNPQLALERLARLCSGSFLLVERIDPMLERYGVLCLAEFSAGKPFEGRWWLPNVATVKAMAVMAGLEPVEEIARFAMWSVADGVTHHVVIRGRATNHPAMKQYLLTPGKHNPAVDFQPAIAGTREKTLEIGQLRLRVEMPRRFAEKVAPLYRRLSRRPAPKAEAASPSPNGNSNGKAHLNGHSNEASDLLHRIEGIDWYHTIDLGHGVVTPGFVDHREQIPAYHLPESMAGLRCLDVATFDGFWSYEMEKRGAAEVIGIDIAKGTDVDIPMFILDEAGSWPETSMGAGFRAASKILGSKVRHEICNVYDLTPERFGMFDIVFLSDLLLHLRNPQLALERIASVCRGKAIIGEVYNPMLECVTNRNLTQYVLWVPGSYTWWQPSSSTLRQMMKVAGFDKVEEVSRLTLQTRGGDCAKVIYHGTVQGGS